MFLRMVRSGYYDNTLFNRVIKSFVIQGGELDDIIEAHEKSTGREGPRIEAELNDSLYHKRGALGAGRNDNPEKKSFVNQFYIVQGKKYTDEQLNDVETKRLKGRKIPAWQREIYKTTGGTPFLDHDYTIFGEVVTGMDVVDNIAAVETDKQDVPAEPVIVHMRILSRRESIQLFNTLTTEYVTGVLFSPKGISRIYLIWDFKLIMLRYMQGYLYERS
jgi:peptidyl-prolyl cis-trans isomerase B (cyclophilin B)